MTIRAAGIMLATSGGRALFLRRADSGLWAFPGGHIEEGETAEQAAERETCEEIGPVPHGALKLLTRRIATGGPEEVDFTTFLAKVDEEFIPTIEGEHTAWMWADISAPPEPLHPGVRVALDRPSMDELGVARAMAAGDLSSPQQYGTFWLWSIRITGTGAAYRDAHDEYCWRPTEEWLTEDALARCNGLPVVFIHPAKKPRLDSKEFNDRIVGTVFLPFTRGTDLWAVAKIYDQTTVELLMSEQFSTSPGVVFTASSGNQTLQMQDGSKLLIEGKPALLDHIALVPNGVWDRGSGPSGVDTRNDSTPTTESLGMTEEEKAAAEQARKDAAGKLDVIMDSLKGLATRMDSMEREDKARKDAEESEHKDASRRDAARKDRFGSRKDGESYKDYRARHDADEAAMCDAMRKDGADDEKAKADSAGARKDAEDEHRRADESFEKWAKEEEGEGDHKADKARKDAEDKEREDAARKDAVMATENADLKARLLALEGTLKGLTAETPAAERDALATAQSRADSIAALFGDRASPPIPGENSLAYRRRLLSRFQRHSDRFKDKRFDSADSDTLSLVEDTVYADAANAAKSPGAEAIGRLIPVERTDAAGRRITSYNGDPMAWMRHFMTGAQVGRILRPQNRA